MWWLSTCSSWLFLLDWHIFSTQSIHGIVQGCFVTFLTPIKIPLGFTSYTTHHNGCPLSWQGGEYRFEFQVLTFSLICIVLMFEKSVLTMNSALLSVMYLFSMCTAASLMVFLSQPVKSVNSSLLYILSSTKILVTDHLWIAIR